MNLLLAYIYITEQIAQLFQEYLSNKTKKVKKSAFFCSITRYEVLNTEKALLLLELNLFFQLSTHILKKKYVLLILRVIPPPILKKEYQHPLKKRKTANDKITTRNYEAQRAPLFCNKYYTRIRTGNK